MQAHGVTEMNFGLHAGARGDRKRSPKFIAVMSLHRHGATASVRRNLLRHEFAQARGDRKRSPKFISA
jgi:hypothetical protein